MERLRELFVELGFDDVRTYIQSGNVIFRTPSADRAALSNRIGDHLRKALGYEVAVCLRTLDEIERIVVMDPFKGIDVKPDMRLCVVFTNKPIPEDLELPLRSPKNDIEIVRTTRYEAFVIWYLVGGRAPAAKGFQERILGRDATTRYLQTVVEILQAAKKG